VRTAQGARARETVKCTETPLSDSCENWARNSYPHGSGASLYVSSSPLQRLQRDVEVLKGHVIFDRDRVTELAGRVALGLPLRPTDMV
jgi:hypothetical protein